jgi:phage tail-like protein
MAGIRSSYSSVARYGLELNGASMGFVESFEGGNATADVVVESPAADGIAHKQLGPVKYEEIVLTCDASMSQAFYNWLAAALNGKPTTQNGAVVAYDSNLTEAWRWNFFNALVSEVGFPALDGSSKDAATLCVKLAADHTRRATTSVGKAAATGSLGKVGAKGSLSQKAKQSWSLSNFRLDIDGLNCGSVNRIEAITVAQQFTQSEFGAPRSYQRLPSCLQISNLVVTLLDNSNAADFYAWHQSFVIEGNHTQKQEKNGTLELLSANDQDVLFTLQFNNLGIFRLAPFTASSDAISQIQAEMYCDQVLFTAGASAVPIKTIQHDTTIDTQITVPVNGGQLGVAATGMQIQATPRKRTVSVPRLPVQVSAGSVTPDQGPLNLAPQQRQPVIPRAPTLRFRNLSSTAEIT